MKNNVSLTQIESTWLLMTTKEIISPVFSKTIINCVFFKNSMQTLSPWSFNATLYPANSLGICCKLPFKESTLQIYKNLPSKNFIKFSNLNKIDISPSKCHVTALNLTNNSIINFNSMPTNKIIIDSKQKAWRIFCSKILQHHSNSIFIFELIKNIVNVHKFKFITNRMI